MKRQGYEMIGSVSGLGLPPDKRRSLRWGLLLLTLLFGGVLATIGYHQARAALAVIDNSNLAQNASTAARAAEQLIKMGEQLTQLQGLLKSVGVTGGFGSAGDLGGILRTGSGISGVLGRARGLESFVPDLSPLQDMASKIGTAADISSVTDYGRARRVIDDIFAISDKAQPYLKGEGMQTAIRARKGFHQTSAADAVALAAQSRNGLAQAGVRVGKVAAAATAAETMREQIAVNTAAVLLAVEEIQQLRGLVAAQTQLMGAAFFGDRPPSDYLMNSASSVPPAPGQSPGIFSNQ